MKWAALALLVALGAGVGPVVIAQASRLTFEGDRPGPVPPGFTLAAMRQPTPGAWTVRRTDNNSYLFHDADPAQAAGFAMALAPGDTPRDVVVSAKLRLSGGARAGGLVWRYRDATNYYAAVLDLGRAAIALYRVVDGNRVRLESEDGLALDPDAWHTMRIVSDDNDVTVSLGGLRVFQERARADQTPTPGRAGVIATGASQVWFDDLTIDQARRRR